MKTLDVAMLCVAVLFAGFSIGHTSGIYSERARLTKYPPKALIYSEYSVLDWDVGERIAYLTWNPSGKVVASIVYIEDYRSPYWQCFLGSGPGQSFFSNYASMQEAEQGCGTAYMESRNGREPSQ